MSFERARSMEHKEKRWEEIMSAALEQLETTDYEKITLAAIAKKLSFTRANLYKYISSKDEIFLKIMLRDTEAWVNDIVASFETAGKLENREIAALWSQVLCRHTRVIKLMSLLNSIIEQNVTVERLAAFKKELMSLLMLFIENSETILPRLNPEQRQDFFTSQFFYASGLYPALHETELQKEAAKLAGIEYKRPDFCTEMTRFIRILLDGLEQEA